MTTEEWNQRARDNAPALIELESLLDTLIENHGPVLLDSPSSIYGQLRTAVDALQLELSNAGIKGKWTA